MENLQSSVSSDAHTTAPQVAVPMTRTASTVPVQTPSFADGPSPETFLLDRKHFTNRPAQVIVSIVCVGFLIFEAYVFIQSVQKIWMI